MNIAPDLVTHRARGCPFIANVDGEDFVIDGFAKYDGYGDECKAIYFFWVTLNIKTLNARVPFSGSSNEGTSSWNETLLKRDGDHQLSYSNWSAPQYIATSGVSSECEFWGVFSFESKVSGTEWKALSWGELKVSQKLTVSRPICGPHKFLWIMKYVEGVSENVYFI